MVKDHKITREETHYIGFSFWLAVRDLLHAPSTERTAHVIAFITPVVEHWLEWLSQQANGFFLIKNIFITDKTV